MNNMTPRVIESWVEPKRRPTRYCEVAGCSEVTREGKPYCSHHISHSPYVQGLMRVLETREKEVIKVAARGHQAVDAYGSVAQELVSYLRINGTKTVARMARDHSMTPEVAHQYCIALRKKGMVVFCITKRGSQAVRVI